MFGIQIGILYCMNNARRNRWGCQERLNNLLKALVERREIQVYRISIVLVIIFFFFLAFF